MFVQAKIYHNENNMINQQENLLTLIINSESEYDVVTVTIINTAVRIIKKSNI